MKTGEAKLFLGVDGGGSKTTTAVIDAAGRLMSEAVGGASNPLRVGVEAAVAEIVAATNRALDKINRSPNDVQAACVGLAGARRDDVRLLLRERLAAALGIGKIEVVTDAEIALRGATNGAAGLVIIAGTGSICYGRSDDGEFARAGGWGPIAGDEGGGAGIARRALQAVAKASDGRAPATLLTGLACDYFRVDALEDLSTAIYAPTMTNDYLANFARFVIIAARRRDRIAIEILDDAAIELSQAAQAVIRKLNLQHQRFQVAFVGGIFNAGELIFDLLMHKIHELAPRAFLAAPQIAPHIAAAQMALGELPAEQTKHAKREDVINSFSRVSRLEITGSLTTDLHR